MSDSLSIDTDVLPNPLPSTYICIAVILLFSDILISCVNSVLKVYAVHTYSILLSHIYDHSQTTSFCTCSRY